MSNAGKLPGRIYARVTFHSGGPPNCGGFALYRANVLNRRLLFAVVRQQAVNEFPGFAGLALQVCPVFVRYAERVHLPLVRVFRPAGTAGRGGGGIHVSIFFLPPPLFRRGCSQ